MEIIPLKNPANSRIILGEGQEGFHTIPNTGNNAHEFQIIEGHYLQIAAVHSQRRQDLSLRTWISVNPIGIPDHTIIETNRFVHLPRRTYVWTIYPSGMEQPNVDSIQFRQLNPGRYYFNVKNLENAENGYRLFFVQIPDGDQMNATKC